MKDPISQFMRRARCIVEFTQGRITTLFQRKFLTSILNVISIEIQHFEFRPDGKKWLSCIYFKSMILVSTSQPGVIKKSWDSKKQPPISRSVPQWTTTLLTSPFPLPLLRLIPLRGNLQKATSQERWKQYASVVRNALTTAVFVSCVM